MIDSEKFWNKKIIVQDYYLKYIFQRLRFELRLTESKSVVLPYYTISDYHIKLI